MKDKDIVKELDKDIVKELYDSLPPGEKSSLMAMSSAPG